MASPLPPPAIPSPFIFGTLIPDRTLMPSHPRKHQPLSYLQTKPPFSLIFQTTPFSPSPPLPPGSSNANGATPKKPPRFPVVSWLSPSIQTDINSQPLPAFHPDILSSTSLISKTKLASLLFQRPISIPSPLSVTHPMETDSPQPPPTEQSKSINLTPRLSKRLSKATTIISSRLLGVRTHPF